MKPKISRRIAYDKLENKLANFFKMRRPGFDFYCVLGSGSPVFSPRRTSGGAMDPSSPAPSMTQLLKVILSFSLSALCVHTHEARILPHNKDNHIKGE